jgi:hypothetical protein
MRPVSDATSIGLSEACGGSDGEALALTVVADGLAPIEATDAEESDGFDGAHPAAKTNAVMNAVERPRPPRRSPRLMALLHV